MEEIMKIILVTFGPLAAYAVAGLIQVKVLSYITRK